MRRILLGLALVVTACGVGADAPSEPDPTTTAPPDTTQPPTGDVILRCDEVSRPTTDPSLYGDTPKYVGNEMPVEEVRNWASRYPEFVDIWIDREHNGWVTAAFSDNVAERQAEIEEEFPGEGVVAVAVDWTQSDLSDLQQQVGEELDGVVEIWGSWIDPVTGYVGLSIDVLSEENLAAIGERLAGERICVEGLEPEDTVPAGPQPQEGAGWRLLVDEQGVGSPFETGLAWDRGSLADLLDRIGGLADVDLEVDFENEVVIWFGAVYGSSCPNLRLDDVVVDDDLVHATIVNTDNAFACTDDANSHTYLVAVERSKLPEAPFYVSADADAIVGRLLVEADLREPGSTASPDQVGPDPDPPEREPEGSGVIIETGFPWEYTVDLACDFASIGEINSYEWAAAETIPDSWVEAAGDSGTVVVEVLLQEGPEPFLEVTFQGETVTYEPADEAGCS